MLSFLLCFFILLILFSYTYCVQVGHCHGKEEWLFIDNSLPLEPLSEFGKKTIELFCGDQLFQIGSGFTFEVQDNMNDLGTFELIENAELVIHDNKIDILFLPVPDWNENTFLRLIVNGEKFGHDKPVPIKHEKTVKILSGLIPEGFSSEIVPQEEEIPWIQPKSMDFEPKIVDIGSTVQFEVVFYPEENKLGTPMESLNSKYEIQYATGAGCLLYDWSKKKYVGPSFQITSENTFDIVIKGKYGIVFTGMFTLTSGGETPPVPKTLSFEPESVEHYSKPTFCIKLYSDEEKKVQITLNTRNYVINGQYDMSCLTWNEQKQCYMSKYIKIYDYNYFTITSKIHSNVELKGYYEVLPGEPPQEPTYPPLPESVEILTEDILYGQRTDIKLKLYANPNLTGDIITEESGKMMFSCGHSAIYMDYDSLNQIWIAKNVILTETIYYIYSEYFYGAIYRGTLNLVNNTSENNLDPNWIILSYWENYESVDCYPPFCKEDGSKYTVIAIFEDETLSTQKKISDIAEIFCGTTYILLQYDANIQMPSPYWFNGTPLKGAYKTYNPFEPSKCDFSSPVRFSDPDDGTRGPIIVYERDDIFFSNLNLPENPESIPDYSYLITQENVYVSVGKPGEEVQELEFIFTIEITSTENENYDITNSRIIIDILGSLYEAKKLEGNSSSMISFSSKSGEVIGVYKTKSLNIPNINDWDGNISLWVDDKNSLLPLNTSVIPSRLPNNGNNTPSDPGTDPDPNPDPIVPPPEKEDDLTTGEIIGIVMGCVVAVVIVILGSLFGTHIIKCPKRGNDKKKSEEKSEKTKTDVEINSSSSNKLSISSESEEKEENVYIEKKSNSEIIRAESSYSNSISQSTIKRSNRDCNKNESSS